MDFINISVITLISLGVGSSLLFETVGKGAFALSIKTVCSLTILIALLNVFSPVLSFIENFKIPDKEDLSFNENNSDYNDAIINETASNISKYTKDMLSSTFGIPLNDFDVSVILFKNENNDVKIDEICITFSKSPQIPSEIITDFISRELMCNVTLLLPDILKG